MDELTKAKAVKVFRIINEIYGSRCIWISDLAELLSISSCNAGILTSACGYQRGKMVSEVTLTEFCATTGVAAVLEKIPNEALEDRRHYLSL